MNNFFEENNISKESRISIVLNTFMYIDYCDVDDKTTLKASVDSMYRRNQSGELELNSSQKAALYILEDYLKKPENSDIADLKIVNFSNDMGEDYKGAYAATFQTRDSSEVYVVYRGTGSGRWYDNGDALANVNSMCQRVAERYFNDTMEKLALSDSTNLIVTGHSKGGNLSQYVTLVSPYNNLIDKCISFDGQGFSPEFLSAEMRMNDTGSMNVSFYDNMADILPQKYRKQTEKMYSICGDNDYVNVLGIKVIPQVHLIFIETLCSVFNIRDSHSIVPEYSEDLFSTKNNYLFNWDTNEFNSQTYSTRDFSDIVKNVSRYLMAQPVKIRKKYCHAIMDLLEKYLCDRDKGLYGEDSTMKEYLQLIKTFPAISFIAQGTQIRKRIDKANIFDLENKDHRFQK